MDSVTFVKAMADETRQKIMQLLCCNWLCVNDVVAQLGEVLAGTRPVAPDATVVFDSIGMACQDIAAATLVYGLLTA